MPYKYKDPEARKEYRRLYRLANKEKLKEYRRLYRLANKEKLKEYKRLYRLANKEKLKEYRRLYRLENKEKLKEKNRLYRLENKEKIKEKNKKYNQTKAGKKCNRISHWKQRGIIDTYNDNYETIYKIYSKHTNCTVCNKLFNQKNKMDFKCVDHDHQTGKMRTICCGYCNLHVIK